MWHTLTLQSGAFGRVKLSARGQNLGFDIMPSAPLSAFILLRTYISLKSGACGYGASKRVRCPLADDLDYRDVALNMASFLCVSKPGEKDDRKWK